jgi:tetrahedral aminopeptidase
MEESGIKLLERLLTAPGTSGFEADIQNVVRDVLKPLADEVRTDVHGNVIAVKNPAGKLRVMLEAHVDQIGLLVSHIDEQGFIYFQTIGGWDPHQLVGVRVAIWTPTGPIQGVISRKAIHLQDDNERKQLVQAKELWIDIGATNQADAKRLVKVGDTITYQLGMQQLLNRLATAPAMDNRTGVWVVLEAFRRTSQLHPDCALFAALTVQEEIGLRGAQTAAYSIDPHVAVAVDVTHATDCPTIDKRQQGDISLGRGPVVFRGVNINPLIAQRLIDAAEQQQIPIQLSAIGRAAPNNSNVLQLSRGGVASGLVSIPNRYMHSAVETVSLTDLNHAADLLAHFVSNRTPGESFVPVSMF